MAESLGERIKKLPPECYARLADMVSVRGLRALMGQKSEFSEAEDIERRCTETHPFYGSECGNRKDGKCCLDLSDETSGETENA